MGKRKRKRNNKEKSSKKKTAVKQKSSGLNENVDKSYATHSDISFLIVDLYNQNIEHNTEVEENPKKGKNIKIPPLVITSEMADALGFMNSLKKAFGDHVNFEYNTKSLKVNLDPIQYYLMLKKKLLKSKVEFYTHALPSEKYKHIVLKGLPNIEIKSIMECLILQNQ